MALFFLPAYTQAAIVINEVAWMGTNISANDEWIELYNTGSQSVDVEGWVLSDGMNLEITLTGAIGAGQYAVLERTDDNSAPGTAFLIYTGALSNGGVTLSLYRADSSIEDRIVGGENWQNIGGDNVTKETAQYTSAGWITAGATPGATNASEASAIQNTDTIPDTTNTTIDNNSDYTNTSSGASNTTTLYATPRTLTLTLDAPTRAYVNQEVFMTVGTTGLADGILQSLIHSWNFGDMSATVGEEVTHRFAYPGEYVVTLHSSYKDYEAYARHTIVVLPVSFSMTTNASGDVQVHNNARYEVDVSGYKIIAGKTIQFPKGTILLPHATITIPKEKLKYISTVTLFDDMTTVVATLVHEKDVKPSIVLSAEPKTPVVQQVALVPSKNVVAMPTPGFAFVDETVGKVEEKVKQGVLQSLGTQQVADPIDTTEAIPIGKWPYFALLGVIGLGVTAVFVGKVKDKPF